MSDEKRPLRICDSCGQIDDHPRHVFATAPDAGRTAQEILDLATKNANSQEKLKAVIAAAQDGTVITKHMDCCEADGCPDGSCTEVRKGAEDKKGADLVKHLTGGN